MRLTNKNKEEGYYYLPEQLKEYQVDVNFQPSLDKLGQLEDVEDELGIDLITLFKALKYGAYIPFYGQIMSLERYKLDFPNKRFIAKYFNGNEWEETLYFKDYGRTWALTKGELL